MGNFCQPCFEKQRTIDNLQEENRRLKGQIRYLKAKATEGFFGSSTPSSKKPVKADTDDERRRRKGGARPGHAGHGRTSCSPDQADGVVDIPPLPTCPHCGEGLELIDTDERTVIESEPLSPRRRVYRLPRQRCVRCKRLFRAKAPSVLPKSLYGNQLLANAAVVHYLHGVPMGRICEQWEIGAGSLMGLFHRLAGLFKQVPDKLILEYRASWVKQADETGWRKDGKNGYAWLFATSKISVFLFGRTRSASVAKEVLGEYPLPGYLVVDRYAGYNWALCIIQYCYSHLLREVQALEKEFSEDSEVKVFVDVMAPLLASAIKLRNQPISDEEFSAQAKIVKSKLIAAVGRPANHLGIRRIQDIFREQEHRMYHWAVDRRVPADNNLAERDLRPTVVARKVSFGSQSDAGAETRGILMTTLYTLRKRGFDVTDHLKTVLDKLADDINQDPFPLLFPAESTISKNIRTKGESVKTSTSSTGCLFTSAPTSGLCTIARHRPPPVHSP
jgi:transposase